MGALTLIGGGWIGDKFSPRVVLSSAYLGIAVLGYLFFLPSPSPLMREILTFIYGVVGSAVLYVNLAGYHVKAVRGHLASRGSGLFVTRFVRRGGVCGLCDWRAGEPGIVDGGGGIADQLAVHHWRGAVAGDPAGGNGALG